MRVAAIANGIVTAVIVAPGAMSEAEFGVWAVGQALALKADAMRALKDEELRIEPGYRIRNEQWLDPIVTPEEQVAEANDRTKAQIVSGYRHNGVMLSTSLEAQMRWLAASLHPTAITFPFVVTTSDDKGTYEVKDQAELTTIVRGMTRSIFTAHQVGVEAKAKIPR